MINGVARPIPDSYWVEPGRFLAGEYPGRSDTSAARIRLDTFLEAGVHTFIDLTQPGELLPYDEILKELARTRGIEVSHTRTPIRDHSVPSRKVMRSILNRIDQALALDNTVYVHCWGGVGRTGTTVGCYLIRHGLTGQQALQQISGWWSDVPKRAYFPRSPETDEQMEFILNWEEARLSPE